MCFIYDEYPSFYTDTIRKARKEHKCCECGETIRKGEQYRYVTGKWDNNVNSYKICKGCEYLRKKIRDIEVGRGCEESESWAAFEDLSYVKADYGLDFIPSSAVPPEYNWKMTP